MFSTAISYFGITGFCLTFYQYNIVDTLFVIYILNTLYTSLYNNNPLILFLIMSRFTCLPGYTLCQQPI